MPRLRGLERAWMKTCECEMTGVCVNVCVSVRVSVPLSVVGPGPLVGEDYSLTDASTQFCCRRGPRRRRDPRLRRL